MRRYGLAIIESRYRIPTGSSSSTGDNINFEPAFAKATPWYVFQRIPESHSHRT
jgi:hypothetical protein